MGPKQKRHNLLNINIFILLIPVFGPIWLHWLHFLILYVKFRPELALLSSSNTPFSFNTDKSRVAVRLDTFTKDW